MTYHKSTIYNKELYKKAQEHNQRMIDEYSEDTEESVKGSRVYRSCPEVRKDENVRNYFDFFNGTTMDAIAKYGDCSTLFNSAHNFYKAPGNIGVLNFASYRGPGGGFIKGSMAQEEALCHDSNLYNILSSDKLMPEYVKNRKDQNNGLYRDWAIFSPAVTFMDDYTLYSVDVITCPAPNWREAEKKGISKEENHEALKSRIELVITIAKEYYVNTIILGAFGCGVFKQDPEEVAEIFKEVLKDYSFNNVVFAIPDKEKLDIFKKVFNN